MKRNWFVIFLILFVLASCSDGKNNPSVDNDTSENNDQTTLNDEDSVTTDTDQNDDAVIEAETDEDIITSDEETDLENDENIQDVDTEDADEVNDEDSNAHEGCLDINIGKTYNFGTVVHGGLILKHVTLCNTCSATLLPDPVKKGAIDGKCDSFFIRNLKVGETDIDDATGLEILLSMSLASGECAEFDAVFDTEEADHYPEPILCEVSGAFLNGEEYVVTFTGSSAAFTTIAGEECPSSKGLCYIDGKCYTRGTNKEDNLCKKCDPDTNTSAWTNAAENTVCDDLNTSTDSDKCNDSGLCSGVAGNTSPIITQIDLGYLAACAVDDANKGYCWGLNNAGQNGSGTGDLSITKPMEVIGIIEGIKRIDIGDLNACAVSTTGKAYCWGSNLEGQLGREGNGSTTPVLISGVSDATDITSSGAFSCALLSNGNVKCWGNNEQGTLGNGGTQNSITPVDTLISNVTAISAGKNHVCVIINDGTVECWGNNEFNQLGDTTVEKSSTPLTIYGISNAAKISCGQYHSCVVLETGEINCWGKNDHLYLGNPLETYTTTPVEALLFRTATDVSTYNTHTCATLTDGGAVCWGGNQYSQLGMVWVTEGIYEKIPLDVRNIISDIKSISAGSLFTCAIMTDNSIKCWGDNVHGQLGQGNTDTYVYPLGVIW